MATEVIMPKLGLTMEKGTIGAWLVQEGQAVAKGQLLLEVETDKVTMEVEAQADGVLRKILVPAGEEVAVSQLIGLIGGKDEDLSAYGKEAKARAPVPAPARQEEVSSRPPVAPAADGRRPHRASPKARKMAAVHGIDLQELKGSGSGGRIVSRDVQLHLERQPAPALAAAPAEEELVELTRAQQVAAQRLTASYQQAPHIHVSMEVSAVWLQQFREGYRLEGKKVSFNDLVVKAVARTLGEFPRLNCAYENGRVRQLRQINIGVAVDAPQGLVVPVIQRADGRTIEQIAAESARLIDAAHRGRLGPDDLSGGTFTVSNLGMFGVSRFTAIINPPQVAILAVGAIEKRVVALDNDALAVRPGLTLTLAADHRVIDGALAARFLGRLRQVLETPGLLG
jgi:pyruvate dehydrogenase E2 component (dihydrolipoamide acetyltransferase)